MIDATMHKLGEDVCHGIAAAVDTIRVKTGRKPTHALVHESDYKKLGVVVGVTVKRSISVLPSWCAVGWEEEET